MKNKLLNFTVIFLILGFVVFLIAAAQKSGFNFDASYNLLSYQSLARGTGFNYQYGAKITPFNPPISTGPELYAPAAVIWKLTGRADYFTATYMLIAYFIAFLAFAAFFFFKNPKGRLIFIASFLVLFFLNKKIFDHQLHIDPIGEILSACLAFTGLYFLHKKKLLPSFILFGLALDAKTNIIVALIPVLFLFIFTNYLLPLIRRKKYKTAAAKAVRIFLLSFIILLPYLAYAKVAPALLLNDHEKMIRRAAEEKWFKHQKTRGLGQVLKLVYEPSGQSAVQYFKTTGEKILILKDLYPGGYLMLLVIALSFPVFLLLSRGHFTFHAFLFAGFFLLWWLFGTADPWYRYLFIPELIYSLAIAALLPELAAKKRKNKLLLAAVLTAVIFIPQGSLASISQRFDSQSRENMLLTKELIRPIPQEQIFTYGWFQAPQLMILSGKRFMDYQDARELEKAKEKYDKLYFLATIENTLIQEEMDQIAPKLKLIKAYGYNKLYLIEK
ncbi:MAG: hypothetical protein ABIC19_00940 [Patescibacteria group bacterium]|nr:hypothetical protein [Patescibacteria group bacterium]